METKEELLNKLQKLKDEYSKYIEDLSKSLDRLNEIKNTGNVENFDVEKESSYDKERMVEKRRIEKEVKDILDKLKNMKN